MNAICRSACVPVHVPANSRHALTQVELVWVTQHFENWIRFGRIAESE